jgi:hypothetical protein
MPGSRKNKSKRTAGKQAPGSASYRKGMPARDSVQEIVDFVSPQGVPHKILKTTEIDAYDPPPPPPARKKRTKPRIS